MSDPWSLPKDYDISGLPEEIMEIFNKMPDEDDDEINFSPTEMDTFEPRMGHSSPESPLSYSSPLPFQSQQQQQQHTPQPQPQQVITPRESPQSFPPPPKQQAHSTTELINQLLQLRSQQDVQLRGIREQQKQLFATPTPDAFNTLHKAELDLKLQLEAELQNLNYLEQILLTPGELHRVDYLRNEFQLQLAQIDLFLLEIEQLANQRRSSKPLVSLVIVRQPFPTVPSKSGQFSEDQLILQLLTGASVKVLNCSPMKATLMVENNQGKGMEHKMMENDTQLLDRQALIAKFPLTFLEGTRKNAVYLRFMLDVHVEQAGQQVSGAVESDRSSAPFVVMTNQKQWEGCERTLLLRDAFAGQLEITWCHFANSLQRQFIRATKQDPQSPTRCLSRFDFGYLHEKFLNKRPTMHQKEYDGFWNWYGKCVQVIRYQRHIGQLWQSGLIYGFMTREEVHMALSEEPPGTFVIRFSERHPGQFGIAYVGNRVDHIKHYLVQPKDTAAAKVTLPDFLRERPQFAYLLQFSMLPPGTPQFTKLPKDQALEPYYSRRVGGDTSGSGYDPLT